MSAELLRQAAQAERAEWGDPFTRRNYRVSSAIHLALADLLDATAEHVASHDCEAHCEYPDGGPTCRAALTVARAILDGAS